MGLVGTYADNSIIQQDKDDDGKKKNKKYKGIVNA